MKHDLMLAVIAMAAYDDDAPNVGYATKVAVPLPANYLSTGFFAVAYNYDGKTVISYRGTGTGSTSDLFSDAWYGWGAGAGAETTQAGQAAGFYKSVAALQGNVGTFPYSANVEFTGHSLGGGLVGLMASLYGKTAVVFDNMSYGPAAEKTLSDSLSLTKTVIGDDGQTYQVPDLANQAVHDMFYGTALTKNLDSSHITGYQEYGQILQGSQSTGTLVGEDVNWGFTVPASIKLHSMALLILNIYADDKVLTRDWKAIAYAFGPLLYSLKDFNGIKDIAYSVVQEGKEPSGDAAAQLMFQDMNDLAPLFDSSKTHNLISFNSSPYLDNLAKLILNYDEYLAFTKAHLDSHNLESPLVNTDGVVISTVDQFFAVTLDKSSDALKDIADFSAIDSVKSEIPNLQSAVNETFGTEAKTILDATKFIAFAENATLKAADVTTLFHNDYQIKDSAHAGGIIIGTIDANNITATDNGDVLIGGNEHDSLIGGKGADLLVGGNGNDVLVGGLGNDVLLGGSGSDILIVGSLQDNLPSGTKSGQEIVRGGSGADYIVLTDEFSNHVDLYGGDTSDHISLMPHMASKTVGPDGSFPLFTLSGGTAVYTNTTTHNGGNIRYHDGSDDNVGQDENGQTFKQYEFYDSSNPNFLVEYWLYSDHLKISVYYKSDTPLGSPDYVINIADFNDGEYGITLEKFHIGDTTIYIDYGMSDPVQYSEDPQGVAARNNALQNEIDIGNRLTLTSDAEIQAASRMRAFADSAAASQTPALTADHLMIRIDGTLNADTLTGTAINEKMYGGAGDDTLVGGGGNDRMHGDAGNDVLNGGTGADLLDGGDGINTATYVGSAVGVVINLAQHTAAGGEADGDSLIAIQNLVGSGFADTLTGDISANALQGGAGKDILYGGDGNDILSGDTGADMMTGGTGNDMYFVDNSTDVTLELANGGSDLVQSSITWALSAEVENLTLVGSANINATGNSLNNIITGNSGNNILEGGLGADTLIGGLGTDTASYAFSSIAVTVNLSMLIAQVSTGDASGDVLGGIENLVGSAFADWLTGDANANILSGGAGNDILVGGAGADVLDGGAGTSDMARYYGSILGVTVNLSTGIGSGGDAQGDTVIGIEQIQGSGTGADNLTGDSNANWLYGYGGNDTLNGGAGDDVLLGGDGADALTGGAGIDTARYYGSASGVTVNLLTGLNTGGEAQGAMLSQIENIYGSNTQNDTLTGDAGVNQLHGDGGNDKLTGGAGNDYLSGGTGNDSFVFAAGFGKDVISDFTAGVGVGDVMQLSLGTAFDTYAEVMAATTQVGANTLITISPNDSITLSNVLKAALVIDDFMFV